MGITTKKYLIIIAAMLSVAVFFIELANNDNKKSGLTQNEKNDAFSFVKSMEGTIHDGEVTENTSGELEVNSKLQQMFEYFLAATGEKSLNEIINEIEKELAKKLSMKASNDAKHLLSRYIKYKVALAEVEKNPTSLSNNATVAIRQRFLTMQELRKTFFSQQEMIGLFGFEDAYNLDAISRLEISQNVALTELQKREKINALDAAMSPTLREAKEAPYQIVQLEEQAKNLRDHGASEDEVYRMRAAATTPEAAARLSRVDQEESQWKMRILAYLNEKTKIDHLKLQANDQAFALQQIKDQKFNQEEQKRLPAYE